MAYHNNGIMVKDIKDLMDLWDFSLNDKEGLNPNVIPVNSCTEVFWKCKNGHAWKERVSRVYSRKIKCLYCAGRLIWSGDNDLQTLYPDIASEWDYDKNNITPDKVSPTDTKTYWWKCKHGHPSFQRSVVHRIERHDTCPYCTGRKVISGVNDLQTLYPDIASEWDYQNNKDVKPADISPNTWKVYYWVCPKGHHYKMKVYLRTHSTKTIDCTKCIKSKSTSFPEQAIYYYTKQFYPDAINKWKGLSKTGLELDIYIPSQNIGIEYDGKAYHNSSEQLNRDNFKYEICKSRGIKLIRVKEGDGSDEALWNADEIFYIKKRPSDAEANNFLYFLFYQITKWSLQTNSLGIDINIKRDRPKILEYLIDIENSFGNLYPELAKNWDVEKNGKLTPYMLPPGSNHEAFFKCERCGESWSAPISIVTKWNRTLCKKCSMGDNGLQWTKRATRQNGSLEEKFPELAKQWDVKKNGSLKPYDIPSNYSKSVYWKCADCGYEWQQSPSSRIHKDRISGCPHCSGRVAMPGVDDLETQFPEVAREWDYSKNNGILPSQVRPHSSKSRYWICSKHNIEFKTSPANRVRGCGCRLCKSEKIVKKQGFRIERYTKSLDYIKTYSSLNEAARDLKISVEAIRQAALTGALSFDSYWKYEGTDFKVLKPDKKHQVISINIKTGEKVEYESAREAERKTGVGHTRIMKCCKGEQLYKTAGGFKWEFK